MTISRSETTGGPDADVVVIGAGPAGLSAAVSAADSGAAVALVDTESRVGGQFWRHPPADRVDVHSERLHHDVRRYWALCRRLESHRANGRVRYLPDHAVWAIAPSGTAGTARWTAHVTSEQGGDSGEAAVTGRTLIIATGAYDLPLPFPGWDLPGVMTPGGAQSLLKGHGVVAGSRVVVAGTGPFLLSVASGLLAAGATVPLVAEANSAARWLRQARAIPAATGKLLEGAGYAATLARHRTRYRLGWTILAAHGTRALESVTVAPIDRDGTADGSAARIVPCDVAAVGWGFVPRLDVALMAGCATTPGAHGIPVAVCDAAQRSSVPGVYLAGEVCGVGGASLAVVEGEIAGQMAAAEGTQSGSTQSDGDRAATRPPSARMLRRRRTLRRFAAALEAAYPVPSSWADRLTPETVVCRCEEVTSGEIRDVARRDGVADARGVKLLARPGMGWCQGRICGYAVDCLAARELGRPARHIPVSRAVGTPVPLGMVATRQ